MVTNARKSSFAVIWLRIVSYGAIAFLPVSSPLILPSVSWGQTSGDITVNSLIEKLKTDSADERTYIAHSLAQIGSSAVPSLIESLKNEDWRVRSGAAKALGNLRTDAALTALIETLKDQGKPEGSVFVTTGNIGFFGSTPGNPQNLVRVDAAIALGKIKNDSAVPALVAALKDPEPSMRLATAWGLAQMESTPDTNLKAIATLIADPNEDVRHSAVRILALRGLPALPYLIDALKSSDNVVRRFAAWELGKMGTDAKTAVPGLVAVLKKDPSKWERIHAAIALGKVASRTSIAIPSLRNALKDPDRDVKGTAATVLADIAVSLQEKAQIQDLSRSELNQAISELEASLDILRSSANQFSQKPVERVSMALNVLRGYAK